MILARCNAKHKIFQSSFKTRCNEMFLVFPLNNFLCFAFHPAKIMCVIYFHAFNSEKHMCTKFTHKDYVFIPTPLKISEFDVEYGNVH